MALIIISILVLITLLVLLSRYGHDVWSTALQNRAYNGEKKVEEADDRTYKIIFFLFGLGMSLMLCFLTFELFFDHIIPDNSDTELIDRIEAELEEVPIIDLPPPPPPTQMIQPQVEEAEEELPEEPDITMDTISPEPIEIVISDIDTEEEVTEEVIDNNIYGFGQVSVNSEFPGGRSKKAAFLSKAMKYPLYEMQNEIGGTVYVSFVVEKNGSIGNVAVVRPVTSPALNKEAVRLIKAMPNWVPAKTTDGIIVRQRIIQPIKFAIGD